MRALLVEDSLNFQRGKSPLSSMGVGGFSFDTIKPGAILISKRYFGVTEKTGRITGYNSGKLSIGVDNFLLVTEVRDNADGKTKNISFKRYSSHGFTLEKIKEERQKLRDSGRKSLEWWGILSGFFSAISKAKFDFRFDILVPGFNDLDESISFERGRDPKTSIGIGLGPAQHIKEFERILDMCNFEYEKDQSPDFPDIITWSLIDADFGPLKDKAVFLHTARNRKGSIGWHFRPYSASYFDDPYAILADIIKSVYEDMKDELKAQKESIRYYQERIGTIKDVSKELNLNI